MMRSRLLLILTLVIKVTFSMGHNLKLKPSALSQNMKKFISYMIATNYNEKSGFLMINNEADSDYLDYASKLISQESSAIVYDLDKLDLSEMRRYSLIISFADPGGKLNDRSQEFEGMECVRRKTIVILTTPIPPVFVSFVFESLWIYKLMDTAIAMEENNIFQVFTFNPFLAKDHRMQNITGQEYDIDIFPEKLFNMNGYPIRTLMTKYNSRQLPVERDSQTDSMIFTDYRIVSTVTEKLNATLDIISWKDVVESHEMNPWAITNSMENKSIIQEEIVFFYDIDLVIPSEMFNIHPGFENAYPHTESGLAVVVRKAPRYELTDNMVNAFFPDFVLFYAIVPFCLGTAYLITVKGKRKFLDICLLYMNFYQSLITNTLAAKRVHGFRRVLFGGWLLTCMIITLATLSKMTSILTTTTYAKDLDTIEELKEAGKEIYTFAGYKSEIKKKYKGTDYEEFVDSFKIFQTKKNVEHYGDILYNLRIYGENSAFIFEKTQARGVACLRIYRHNGRPVYHMMREKILPSLKSYHFAKGSPFIPSFNHVLRRLEEAGLVQFWEDQVAHGFIIKGVAYPYEDYDDSPRIHEPMKYEVMKPIFLHLLYGWVISTIVFIIEKIVFQFREDRKKIAYCN